MERISSVKELLIAYGILLVLLGVAIAAPLIHMSAVWNVSASFIVAASKAIVIALVFMDLKRGSSLYTFALVAGVLWLFLLMFISGLDVVTRPPAGL